MDWKELKGFDEKFAKINIRKREGTFGGSVVEVLYGAKDADGNPVMPREDAEDGHGRWFGIDIDGEHIMFSLQKPASEGGEIEYTTDSGDHALEDMIAAIDRKQEICRTMAALEDSTDADAEEKFEALKQEWKTIKNWNTPKEASNTAWFNRLVESHSTHQEEIKRNIADKQTIIEKAKELAESTSWKETQAAFENLRREFRDIRSAGSMEDELWAQFKEYSNAFNAKRKEYFANLDQIRAASKVKKEEIIEQAKEVVKSTNFKAAGEKMNELMEEWKKAGSSGREFDDGLWAQFSELRKTFFDNRKAFFSEMRETQKKSAEIKNKLIDEVREIVEKSDFSKQITERMKEIDKEWKAAGFSGKDSNDTLWETFKEAKNKFWDAKHEDSQKRFKDIITRKEETLKKVRAEIEELQIKEYETEDFDRIRGIQKRVEEKREVADSLANDIKELNEKIDK